VLPWGGIHKTIPFTIIDISAKILKLLETGEKKTTALFNKTGLPESRVQRIPLEHHLFKRQNGDRKVSMLPPPISRQRKPRAICAVMHLVKRKKSDATPFPLGSLRTPHHSCPPPGYQGISNIMKSRACRNLPLILAG